MRLNANEVKRQLAERSMKVVGDVPKTSLRTITHELDAVNWIDQVRWVSDALKKTDTTLFQVLKRRDGGYDVGENGYIAESVIRAIDNAPDFIKKYYPYHEFDPRVEVFFRMLSEDPLVKEYLRTGLRGFSEENATQICDHLNRFVSSFRTEVVSTSFRILSYRCMRRALKVLREMERYVERLFSRCSRLLVVRVDLYYPSVQKDGELNGINVPPDRLRKDRARFIRKLSSEKFATNKLGHCWKLEYGLTKGFHYHWFFFFDGAKVREDITIARLIGQTWEKMQDKEGLYWNCNAAKDKYVDLGIGMISHFDKERRFGLHKAIAYLTKPDYHLCLKEVDVGRTFGKGQIKARPKETRGRPRVF